MNSSPFLYFEGSLCAFLCVHFSVNIYIGYSLLIPLRVHILLRYFICKFIYCLVLPVFSHFKTISKLQQRFKVQCKMIFLIYLRVYCQCDVTWVKYFSVFPAKKDIVLYNHFILLKKIMKHFRQQKVIIHINII